MTQRSYFPQVDQLLDSDRLVVFYDRRIVARAGNYLWKRAELELLLPEDTELLVIDSQQDSAIIAVHLRQDPSALLQAEMCSLRSLLIGDSESVLALAGKANQILDWTLTHRYCGVCGAPTTPHPDQRALICTGCQHQYFPRINPCVIMLIVRGREVLLARSARFTSNFFSCLAGFIEVGETPEQTVIREVREEVGIEIENVRYAKSQSWPFPSQLMLGFYADYKSGEITPDAEEIAEAGWFDVSNLPTVPSAMISVSGELIRDYVAKFQPANLENQP